MCGPAPKRKLKVDLEELAMAMDDHTGEADYYLDLETGQVAMVTGETRQALEEIMEELGDEGSLDDAAVEEAIAGSDHAENRTADFPRADWEQDVLREAHWVDAGLGERYLRIETAESSEGYEDMESFIATVRSEDAEERLWDAIRGRKPFRRFKDVLEEFPREREQWFEFSNARERQRALEWLASAGIECDGKPDAENRTADFPRTETHEDGR